MMSDMKTAECVGVREITRVNVKCPHCGHEHEVPYEQFVRGFGDPFLGTHEKTIRACHNCGNQIKLGKFRLED